MNRVLRPCTVAVAVMLVSSAVPSLADEAGADPALTQQPDPALKKLLPSGREA